MHALLLHRKQGVHCLLKWCSSSTLTTWLRTTRPATVLAAARKHDAAIADAARTLFRLHHSTAASSLLQATLPVGMGGLGYASAERTSEAAWCGAFALAWPTIRRLVAVDLRNADSHLPSVAALHACTPPSPRAAPSTARWLRFTPTWTSGPQA